ncbi:protease [Prochlorococcus marinus str. MIT 9116]|uniref:Protease n=1 Tax=Prochlorococcus marinus str. MIT 9116 TaxID=167544 RepID=A0A0A1ZRE3_PROMR|nr:trypsin-like peptidase domain-containing protein [Prochlorococcus marinus]KGF90839.1 protease [Prochlorococcus marinus str. MIT 9116]
MNSKINLILKLFIFFSFAISPIGEISKGFAFPLSSKCSNSKKIKDIYQNNISGIVTVKAGNSIGTGFVINQTKNKTYFLTNLHVVKGQDDIEILWADRNKTRAYIIADANITGMNSQKKYVDDLAILEMEGLKGEVINFSKRPIAVGDDVFAIGTPKGLDFSLTRGIISAIRENGEIIQTDVALNTGNSGGPLLDKYGCVIGINTFDIKNTEGLNFAISSNVIKNFINQKARWKFGKSGNREEYIKFQEAISNLTRNQKKKDYKSNYYPGPKGSIKPKGKGWFFIKESCKYWDKDKMGECFEKATPIEKEWSWLKFMKIKGDSISNPDSIIFRIKTTYPVANGEGFYEDDFDVFIDIYCKNNQMSAYVPNMLSSTGTYLIDNKPIYSYSLNAVTFDLLSQRGCDVKPID